MTGGLSTGGKVGIAFGVIGFLAIIAVIVIVVWKLRFSRPRPASSQRLRDTVSFAPPTYSGEENGKGLKVEDDYQQGYDGKLDLGIKNPTYDV